MTFGQKLKSLRQNHKMTQTQLADALRLSKANISKYESDTIQPNFETLGAISSLFNVPVDYLLGTAKAAPKKRFARLPVLGNVAAGVPIDAITDVEDFEEIDLDQFPAGEYVALRIKGHSMEPRLLEGDVVIVRIQNTIETGETAIVMVNGDEATCKKIKKTPEGITLISTNPTYEPMFYTNKEIEALPVRIFGRVVEYRGKL